MLEKASNEFLGGQGHGFGPGIFVGPVTEGDFSVGDREDAMVGDGDAVDVSGKIVQYLLWALESGFAVDDPLGLGPRIGQDEARGL